MDQQEIRQNTPLIWGDDGTIRIKNSRVSLEVIVRQFKEGTTAEQLLEDFPSLTLRKTALQRCVRFSPATSTARRCAPTYAPAISKQ